MLPNKENRKNTPKEKDKIIFLHLKKKNNLIKYIPHLRPKSHHHLYDLQPNF